MKEYEENGNLFIEYSFEDWEKGRLPPRIKFGKPPFTHNNNPETYSYIVKKALGPIRKAQSEVYWKEVEKDFVLRKAGFSGRWWRSGNKKRLLESEIAGVRCILFPEQRRLIQYPININLSLYTGLSDLYDQVIVNGNRDFSVVDSPNPTNKRCLDCIRMEGLVKYLNWLESIPESELNNDFLFRTQDSKEAEDPEKKYSLKQVAIAYAAMGELIHPENYKEILSKHTTSKSEKILTIGIRSLNRDIQISESRASNTRLLKDLHEAKRLVSGIKNPKGIDAMNHIIQRITNEIENKV